MGIMGEGGEAFFDRYNAELEQLGCGTRVCGSACGKRDMMSVVDLDGKPIADLPRSIDPPALSVVMLLVEKSFEEGVRIGRSLEGS